jgi:hypothetical protein
MRKTIVTAALLSLVATAASAQPRPNWEHGKFPYAKQQHSVCFEKARRLNGYEMRAKSDGRLTRSERATMASLQRDLDRSCGRFRWQR